MSTSARPARAPGERGIHLFSVAGIRIIIDYSWFVIFALVAVSLSLGYLPSEHPDQPPSVYWAAGLVATLLFFASILFHELAHSLVAIRAGIEIPSITLFLFGGVSRMSEEAKDPATEFKIAIVGPLSSFLLAGVFWLLHVRLEGQAGPIVVSVAWYLAFINVALGVFNLVPGFPLDGGRVLRAIWWWRTGSLERATRLVSDLGKGFALALMFLGGLQIFSGNLLGGVWLIFIGMFLRGAAEQGYQQLTLSRAFEDVKVGDVMIEDVVTVERSLPLRDLVSEYFLRYGYRGFPVVDGEEPVGIVTVSDLQSLSPSELSDRTVADAMKPLDDERLVSRATPFLEALNRLAAPGVGRLVVVEHGRLAGMITKTGVLRLLEMRQLLAPRS